MIGSNANFPRAAAFLVALVISFFTLFTSVQAQQGRGQVLFILDGSGSMWGRIEDRPKISIAKQVMSTLIAELPATIDAGLQVYGHRRKGDCDDIELLAPIGSSDRATLIAQIERISPKGKTPISRSFQLAAERLRDAEDETTVVLISDGKETCDADPCALVQELRDSGIRVQVHVVGFDVDQDEREQLYCIAEAGGGRYFSADSTAQLQEALTEVRQEVVAKVDAKDETVSKKVLKIGPGTIKLKPAPWVQMPPYAWRAANLETEDKPVSVRGRAEMKVKPGEYHIIWRSTEHGTGDVALTAVATVEAGKTVEVPIDTGLEIVVPEGTQPPYLWSLTRPGESEAFAWFKGRLDPQVVPAGTYRLGWRQIEHGAPRGLDFGPVTVEVGKLNRHVLDSGLQVVRADWVPPQPYALELKTAEGKQVGSWRIWNAPLFVPPGVYDVVYRQTEHGHSRTPWGRLTVPEHGFAKVTIDSGVRFKAPPDSEPPYKVIFVSLDTDKEITWNGKWRGKWEPVPVPPGRYRLDWWEAEHGSDRMTLLDEFEIPPSTLVEFQM